jgi:hypothetical protein
MTTTEEAAIGSRGSRASRLGLLITHFAYMCPCPTLQVRGCPPPSHGSGSGWFRYSFQLRPFSRIWLYTSLTLLNPASPEVRFRYYSFIHYFTAVYPDAIQAETPAPQKREPYARQRRTDAFAR